jgi:hypothetical protein
VVCACLMYIVLCGVCRRTIHRWAISMRSSSVTRLHSLRDAKKRVYTQISHTHKSQVSRRRIG